MNLSPHATPGHDRTRGPGPFDPLPESLRKRIAEESASRDAERKLPYDTIDALRQSRFGTLRLPRTEGGAGLSWRETIALFIDLAEADSNVAHIWRNHFMLTERLLVHGPDNPTLTCLRKDVTGGALIGLAAAETNEATTLVPDGTGYRLSGRKMYSTGTLYADWIVSYAALPDGIRANLVFPRNRKGITLVDDWNGMGQRLTGTGTTIFAALRLEHDDVISVDDLAPHLMFYTSSVAQLILTGVIAGITAAIARDGTDLIRNRHRSFYFAPSEVAARDPLLLASLGERASEAFAARAIVLEAAGALDRASAAIAAGGDSFPVIEAAALAAAKAKVVVDTLAQGAASALYDLAGASATSRDRNLDRHWRNLRTIASHNPALYKAMAIGDHAVNATPLPAQGLF